MIGASERGVGTGIGVAPGAGRMGCGSPLRLADDLFRGTSFVMRFCQCLSVPVTSVFANELVKGVGRESSTDLSNWRFRLIR